MAVSEPHCSPPEVPGHVLMFNLPQVTCAGPRACLVEIFSFPCSVGCFLCAEILGDSGRRGTCPLRQLDHDPSQLPRRDPERDRDRLSLDGERDLAGAEVAQQGGLALQGHRSPSCRA